MTFPVLNLRLTTVKSSDSMLNWSKDFSKIGRHITDDDDCWVLTHLLYIFPHDGGHCESEFLLIENVWRGWSGESSF